MEAGQERGALLREAILRDSTTLEDTQAAIARVQATMEPTTTPDYITVPGYKNVESVSESQSELLEAVQDVVARLREYWPLSIRQIHYQLLNDPPLWRIVGRSRSILNTTVIAMTTPPTTRSPAFAYQRAMPGNSPGPR